MDRGVMGVQVPHINTAADARRAVTSVKYHPMGDRGLAAGTRPARYGFGLSMADYVELANRETFVCVQLEEAEALRNLDEILSVEGVDAFFVGPSDLSQSMGYPGRTDAPEVRQAMERAFATIAAAGKVSGSAGNAQATVAHRNQKVQYLLTHTTGLLAGGAAAFFKTVKGE
jgi:4-hydroxy-2-oxoheptanedioate aldolase